MVSDFLKMTDADDGWGIESVDHDPSRQKVGMQVTIECSGKALVLI